MNTKQRGFKTISRYQEGGLSVPQRATKGVAEYDFQAAETIAVPGLWKLQQAGENPKPILVKTGAKAYMSDFEYLELVSRSSNPLKRFLFLADGIGATDSDYYNNENNEGHIMFQFLNFGYENVVIEEDEQTGQGTFKPFLLVDNDQIEAEGTGGLGLSGQK